MEIATRVRPAWVMVLAVAAALAATVILAFGQSAPDAQSVQAGQAGPPGQPGRSAAAVPVIEAVGAENQYANVITQVGGRYVRATSLMSNPNTDPHTYEASVTVARQVSQAGLVVQNGLGYDSFMNSIEAAAPSADRKVIDVQQLLGLPASTPNPHLWYDPATMPKVATAIASDLAALDPAHAAYFRANARAFTQSLGAWRTALTEFAETYKGAKVACTEPVADYLLQAAGTDNLTPWSFQASIMNGTDSSPQDVAVEKNLLSQRKVSVFVYNQQVTDPLTQSLIGIARARGIPVVGVYETMPEPGYDYQSWMLAETSALRAAVASRQSSEHL